MTSRRSASCEPEHLDAASPLRRSTRIRSNRADSPALLTPKPRTRRSLSTQENPTESPLTITEKLDAELPLRKKLLKSIEENVGEKSTVEKPVKKLTTTRRRSTAKVDTPAVLKTIEETPKIEENVGEKSEDANELNNIPETTEEILKSAVVVLENFEAEKLQTVSSRLRSASVDLDDPGSSSLRRSARIRTNRADSPLLQNPQPRSRRSSSTHEKISQSPLKISNKQETEKTLPARRKFVLKRIEENLGETLSPIKDVNETHSPTKSQATLETSPILPKVGDRSSTNEDNLGVKSPVKTAKKIMNTPEKSPTKSRLKLEDPLIEKEEKKTPTVNTPKNSPVKLAPGPNVLEKLEVPSIEKEEKKTPLKENLGETLSPIKDVNETHSPTKSQATLETSPILPKVGDRSSTNEDNLGAKSPVKTAKKIMNTPEKSPTKSQDPSIEKEEKKTPTVNTPKNSPVKLAPGPNVLEKLEVPSIEKEEKKTPTVNTPKNSPVKLAPGPNVLEKLEDPTIIENKSSPVNTPQNGSVIEENLGRKLSHVSDEEFNETDDSYYSSEEERPAIQKRMIPRHIKPTITETDDSYESSEEERPAIQKRMNHRDIKPTETDESYDSSENECSEISKPELIPSDSDSDEEDRNPNEFIDDMASVGSESTTPSINSNDIVEVGESIGSTSSQYDSSEDEYESGSFVVGDDVGNADLLSSGSSIEDEENLEKNASETKRERKRIIIIDSDSEPECSPSLDVLSTHAFAGSSQSQVRVNQVESVDSDQEKVREQNEELSRMIEEEGNSLVITVNEEPKSTNGSLDEETPIMKPSPWNKALKESSSKHEDEMTVEKAEAISRQIDELFDKEMNRPLEELSKEEIKEFSTIYHKNSPKADPKEYKEKLDKFFSTFQSPEDQRKSLGVKKIEFVEPTTRRKSLGMPAGTSEKFEELVKKYKKKAKDKEEKQSPDTSNSKSRQSIEIAPSPEISTNVIEKPVKMKKMRKLFKHEDDDLNTAEVSSKSFHITLKKSITDTPTEKKNISTEELIKKKNKRSSTDMNCTIEETDPEPKTESLPMKKMKKSKQSSSDLEPKRNKRKSSTSELEYDQQINIKKTNKKKKKNREEVYSTNDDAFEKASKSKIKPLPDHIMNFTVKHEAVAPTKSETDPVPISPKNIYKNLIRPSGSGTTTKQKVERINPSSIRIRKHKKRDKTSVTLKPALIKASLTGQSSCFNFREEYMFGDNIKRMSMTERFKKKKH